MFFIAFLDVWVGIVSEFEEDAVIILDLRVGYNYGTEEPRRKFVEFDIPQAETYNLDGIPPCKKLFLLDLRRCRGVDVPDYCFFFRKTCALSTKNGWLVNYENICESEETHLSSA